MSDAWRHAGGMMGLGAGRARTGVAVLPDRDRALAAAVILIGAAWGLLVIGQLTRAAALGHDHDAVQR